MLGEIKAWGSGIRHGADTLSGPIRVSAPVTSGARSSQKRLTAFFRIIRPSRWSCHCRMGSWISSLRALIWRYVLAWCGWPMPLRSLGQKRRVVCAAPSYLAQFGTPQRSVNLKDHSCLMVRFGRHLDPHKMRQVVTVTGDCVANDGTLARQWCLSGLAIILKSEPEVGPDLHAGRLVEVLPDLASPPAPVSAPVPRAGGSTGAGASDGELEQRERRTGHW